MPEGQPSLPTGTVTFLRTDVEGSMRFARALGSRWDEENALQLRLIRDAVVANAGVVVRTEGDALFAVFTDALAATRAAIACQRALGSHPWPANVDVRVRIGLHSGEAHLAGDDYGGFDVNRAARVAAVGHGGQIVLSDPTRALIAGDLPAGVAVRDLGRHPLRDVPQPEHLFQLDVEGLPRDFPPLRTTTAVPGNLPERLTSFVGRQSDLETLSGLLVAGRLLTITGPGGIGKTSLAVELARARTADYPDGAWFVPLDVVTDAAEVPTAIARTVGLYDGPGRPPADGVARYFADRTALLILDNFEHVMDAVPAVSALLAAAPSLHILVTSRMPLRIRGEQDYPVAPLDHGAQPGTTDTGAGPSACMQLFAERARSARPDWRLEAHAAIVAEVCGLLDGLPLGIELAAARIGLLPASLIRDRLAARLPLPGHGPRDVPDRQRTIDGTIAWSYDLLAVPQQELFRALAVFEGGFDLEQARLVAPAGAADEDVLDRLFDLADASLIERDVTTDARFTGGGLRFRMLETVRTFALRKLDGLAERLSVEARHAGAFLALAEAASHQLPGIEQARWLDRLAADHANLAAALRGAVERGDVEVAQRLAGASWRYWQLGGHLSQGRALIDPTLEMPGGDAPTLTRQRALAAAGGLAYWQADQARAGRLYAEQWELAQRLGDPAAEADAASNLAATEFIAGDPSHAVELGEQAQARYTLLGDVRGLARLRWARTNLLLANGLVEPAIRELEILRGEFIELGDPMYQAMTEGSLGWAYLGLGDAARSAEMGIESFAHYHLSRDVATTTITLEGAALNALELGLVEPAAVLMGAFQALCAIHGVRPPARLADVLKAYRPMERLREALPPGELEAALERGRRLSLDEAAELAVTTIRGELARGSAAGSGDDRAPGPVG